MNGRLLTERLRLTAWLVSQARPSGTVRLGTEPSSPVILADIGCDHAYLSIDLLLTHTVDFAVCTDLREGPLASAAQNLEKYGLTDRSVTLLTNGLAGVEKYRPTHIAICGMGGENILHILQEASFICSCGQRLVLQPQSFADELYTWLTENGFSVICERFALEGFKPYRILSAIYDGITRTSDPVQACLGHLYFEEDASAYRFYLEKQERRYRKKLLGLQESSPEADRARTILAAVKKATAALLTKEEPKEDRYDGT